MSSEFPDDADILAEEEFLSNYNDIDYEDLQYEDEPPDMGQLFEASKKQINVTKQSLPASSSFQHAPANLQSPAVTIDTESRKRQQNDLFGDLDDLEDFPHDGEELVPNGTPKSKKQKLTSTENVTTNTTASSSSSSAALKSLFAKKPEEKEVQKEVTTENHHANAADSDSYMDRLEAIIAAKQSSHQISKSEVAFHRRRRYAFKTVPDVPFQSMTNSKGQRMYMILKQRNRSDDNSEIRYSSSHRGGLLAVPIATLKLEAQKEKEKKELAAAEALKKRFESFGKLEYKKKRKGKEKNLSQTEDSSWLESYRPQKYFDLLSHEATNRALLRWLKLWDKVVFNREVKIRPRHQDGSVISANPPQPLEEKPQNPKWNSNFRNQRFQKKPMAPDESVIQELDDKSRPIQRVALLCGPPGLGKTTLAHVVATHAGYNVVEMNASDDRSADAFRLQLENATQMQSVIKADPRPNCLIIDEIDGAPVAAINVLLSYIQAQDGDKQKGKKKKEGIRALQRPVICICNDLYTPSLRQLRQMALVLTFPPTESSRLAHRLMEIAKEHNIDTDLSTLLALCEKSENDIRSCLATLYFFRLQGKAFRFHNVLNSSVGLKDSNRSMFSVWQDIFQKQRSSKISFAKSEPGDRARVSAPDDKKSNESLRYSAILDAVQACGDYERLVNGVFENYQTVKFRDNKLENVCAGMDWMCYYDLIHQQIQHSQNYSMMPFMPHILVKLHFLFASLERPKINFPKTQSEMHAALGKNENVVNSLMLEMAPSTRVFTTPRSLVLDILPFMVDCLTPNFRPVSTQLYSIEERQEVLRVVTAMLSFNMTYRQERTQDGQYVYVLDPNVEDLIYLDKTKQRRQLAYASKQLIAREIDLEKMRRNAGVTSDQVNVRKTAPVAVAEKTDKVAKVVPNHLQTLKPKAVNVVEVKAARDFFGRIINKPKPDQTSEGKSTGQKDLLEGDVWFRFKEGYSNAVRRKVHVKDFL